MKLLAIILTSSKLYLLKRGLDSILNQRKVSFKYDIVIIVNTKNDEYYQEVLRMMKEPFYKEKKIVIYRTESNGFPGMGHNSCLELFKKREEYTHMTMLDGDDMYYPVAFQQFEKMLKKEPELDLVHLMLNDRVHWNNDDLFNYKKLKFNYKLISSFEENENWWRKIITKSPLLNRIEDTKTPSRILIVSREIFKTTHPIRYSEEMTLYDDMITFFSFYEAQLRGEINTFATSETNIYLYNSLNDHSASYNFKEKDAENFLFKKEISIYTNTLKDNWNIRDLPFIKVDKPKDFNTQDKIIFCNKYMVDLEIKKKFGELKKLQAKDVEIKMEDKEILKKVEFLFLFLVQGGFDTANNLLKLAEINFLLGNLNGGLVIIMQLLQRNPTSQIIKKIFKILFEYKLYDRCEYYYNLLKTYNSIDDEIKEKYNIIKSLKFEKDGVIYHKNKKLLLEIDENKETFCYFTGYTDKFNGENYGEKNVYGSEISAIKLCEKLTKYYNVIILNENEESFSKYNGVYYLNHNFYNELVNNFKVDHFVISRFISGVLDMDFTKVENLYYIMHDARVHDLWHSENLPLLSIYAFKNFLTKIKKVICVSKWQKENFLNFMKSVKITIPDEKFHIIGNGINIEKFEYNKIKKINNKFVYCSDPDRGLEILCEILIELQKKYEDIRLDIYFGNLSEKYSHYVKDYKWINFHGKVTNDQICKEFSKSDFWCYPNINSHETFCISCIEAQCGGNVIITRDFSALPELVKDNGILIPKELEGEDLKKYTIGVIDHILENNLKDEYQKKAHFNSLQYDWENISTQWYNFLNKPNVI